MFDTRIASEAYNNVANAPGGSDDGSDSAAARVRVRGEDDEGSPTVLQTLKLLCSSRKKTRVLLTQMYALAWEKLKVCESIVSECSIHLFRIGHHRCSRDKVPVAVWPW